MHCIADSASLLMRVGQHPMRGAKHIPARTHMLPAAPHASGIAFMHGLRAEHKCNLVCGFAGRCPRSLRRGQFACVEGVASTRWNAKLRIKYQSSVAVGNRQAIASRIVESFPLSPSVDVWLIASRTS